MEGDPSPTTEASDMTRNITSLHQPEDSLEGKWPGREGGEALKGLAAGGVGFRLSGQALRG